MSPDGPVRRVDPREGHRLNGPERLSLPAEPAELVAGGAVAPGQGLEVSYGGQWYAATVVAVEADGRLRIHYDGWSDEWDEAVPLALARQRQREG